MHMIYKEKAMAPHSSTLAWKIPWMEKPGGLQSMGSRRVGHNWATSLSLFTFLHWRRKWQPTPVFLPGESQGRGSLVVCCLWGRWLEGKFWEPKYRGGGWRSRIFWIILKSDCSSLYVKIIFKYHLTSAIEMIMKRVENFPHCVLVSEWEVFRRVHLWISE